jgi:hypothetical protein
MVAKMGELEILGTQAGVGHEKEDRYEKGRGWPPATAAKAEQASLLMLGMEPHIQKATN